MCAHVKSCLCQIHFATFLNFKANEEISLWANTYVRVERTEENV